MCEVAFPSSWPREVLMHLLHAGGVESSAEVPPLGWLILCNGTSRGSVRSGLEALLLGRLITCKTTEASLCLLSFVLFCLSFHFEINQVDSLEVAKITQRENAVLTGGAHLVGHHPTKQKSADLIPSWGTGLGLRVWSLVGVHAN